MPAERLAQLDKGTERELMRWHRIWRLDTMADCAHRKYKQYVQAACILSLTCSLLLLAWLSLPPMYALLAALMLLLFVAAWVLIPCLVGRKCLLGFFLLVAVLNLTVCVPELVLRIADFHYEPGVQFAYPRHFVRFEPDPNLFWRYRSGEPGINSWGFPDEEVVSPKPEGTFRVVFLGDSCTAHGFPDFAEVILNIKSGKNDLRFESITLAVPGYSSHQGRKVAELYGILTDPNIVVVYYGWNDHWEARGNIDSEKRLVMSQSRFSKSLSFALRKSRLLQLVALLGSRWINPVKLTGSPRVPITEYVRNLQIIRDIFASQNVPTVFVTAPTSHYKDYKPGAPDYTVEQDFLFNKASVWRLHKEYNAVVREVAKQEGSYLCDLEKIAVNFLKIN